MRILLVFPLSTSAGGVELLTSEIASLVSPVESIDIVSADGYEKSAIKRAVARFLGLSPLVYLNTRRMDLSQYDVVISSGEFGIGVSGNNVVHVFHGTYLGYSRAINKYIGLKEHLSYVVLSTLQRIATVGKTKIVAVSEKVADECVELGIRDVQVIENAIDTSFWRKIESARIADVLFVGSSNEVGKGLDVIRGLSSKFSKVIVTADKPNFDCTWIASADRIALRELYNRCGVFVFPSRYEGFGLVILEALACGSPILIRASLGISAVIKNYCEEFVIDDMDNIPEVESRIELLLQNREYFSQQAMEIMIEEFSYPRFCHKWIKVLRDAMEN